LEIPSLALSLEILQEIMLPDNGALIGKARVMLIDDIDSKHRCCVYISASVDKPARQGL